MARPPSTYEIPLRHDRHTGTNWYHPHVHGLGAQQLFDGRAGALLVVPRGRRDRAAGVSRERVLAIPATGFDDDGDVVPPLSSGQAAQQRLVNGQVDVPVDAPSHSDTAIVGNDGGSVTLRTRFEHFLGTAIYHCHFVTHAELG